MVATGLRDQQERDNSRFANPAGKRLSRRDSREDWHGSLGRVAISCVGLLSDLNIRGESRPRGERCPGRARWLLEYQCRAVCGECGGTGRPSQEASTKMDPWVRRRRCLPLCSARLEGESSPRPPDGRTGDCAPSRPVALRLARPLLARWWRRLSVCRVPPHPPSPTRPATLSPAAQPCPAHPGPPQPVPGPAAIWRPAFQRRPRRATRTRGSSLPRATNKAPGPGQIALRKSVQGDLYRMPHVGRGSPPDSERCKQIRINLLSFDPAHTWKSYIYIYI